MEKRRSQSFTIERTQRHSSVFILRDPSGKTTQHEVDGQNAKLIAAAKEKHRDALKRLADR